MSAVDAPPVDRGKVFILWVVQALAALGVVVLVGVTWALISNPIVWRVDPTALRPGTEVTVTVSSVGDTAYVRCPSLFDDSRTGPEPPCQDASSTTALQLVGTTVGAVMVALIFVGVRRSRIREKHRAEEWDRTEPAPREYHQSGMPAWFWAAFLGVGVVVAVGVAGTVVAVKNGRPASIAGLVFYSFMLYEIGWVQGVRRAYAVYIDERQLHWAAPLRTVSVPLGAVQRVVLPSQGTFREPAGKAVIDVAGREPLEVTLPDNYRRWQFRRFAETLRARGIRIDTPEA